MWQSHAATMKRPKLNLEFGTMIIKKPLDPVLSLTVSSHMFVRRYLFLFHDI